MTRFGAFLIFASMIVILIAFVNIANPMQYLWRRNDKIRINDLKKISAALEEYYSDYGHYPSYDTKSYTIRVDEQNVPWGTPWDPYLSLLPKDPWIGKYIYYSDNESGNRTFRLYASLDDPENGKDSCQGECPNVPDKNLCGKNKKCNYGVTSKNVSP